MEILDRPRSSEQCRICEGPVLVTINRGTGICSENCRKTLREVKVP